MTIETQDAGAETVGCVILAGGQARRMGGGDKALLPLRGRPLLAHVLDAIGPQVGPTVLNANGDAARFGAFGLPVVADSVADFPGPLAGVLAGLDWLRRTRPEVRWMVSIAADTPLFPADLVARLRAAVAREGAEMACAASMGRTHPVIGLWPVALADALRHALVEEDERKIDAWTGRYRTVSVEWPGDAVDPFFNVNTPEDLAWLEVWLTARAHGPAPLSARHPVGVVIDRQPARSQWIDHLWRPVEVLTDPPPGPAWRELRRDGATVRFLATGIDLHLHRSDIASYRYNLTGAEPRLYVVLRPAGDGAQVLLVSAAPDEAQLFMDTGENIVEALPMPARLRDLVGAFVAAHPPPPPMRKRKRKPADAGDDRRRG